LPARTEPYSSYCDPCKAPSGAFSFAPHEAPDDYHANYSFATLSLDMQALTYFEYVGFRIQPKLGSPNTDLRV
jgi:hypothetical protein